MFDGCLNLLHISSPSVGSSASIEPEILENHVKASLTVCPKQATTCQRLDSFGAARSWQNWFLRYIEKCMNLMRAHYLPPLYQDSPEEGKLILRDGSTANIRSIRPEDQEATQSFFERLSPESRWLRFFSVAKPDPKLIQAMCNPTDPTVQTTLVVTRIVEGDLKIIAVATYWGQPDKTAEVALAVDDLFQ